MKRLYILRKFVVANSAKDAIKNEKYFPVHDVWLEEKSSNEVIQETIQNIKKSNTIGFVHEK